MPATHAWHFAEVLNFFGILSQLNCCSHNNAREDNKVEKEKDKSQELLCMVWIQRADVLSSRMIT